MLGDLMVTDFKKLLKRIRCEIVLCQSLLKVGDDLDVGLVLGFLFSQTAKVLSGQKFTLDRRISTVFKLPGES